jgi:hypothetical protein
LAELLVRVSVSLACHLDRLIAVYCRFLTTNAYGAKVAKEHALFSLLSPLHKHGLKTGRDFGVIDVLGIADPLLANATSLYSTASFHLKQWLDSITVPTRAVADAQKIYDHELDSLAVRV